MPRYVLSEDPDVKLADVSEAVDRLVVEAFGLVPPIAFQDSNEFRSRYCYIEETSEALKEYETSLRAMFAMAEKARKLEAVQWA